MKLPCQSSSCTACGACIQTCSFQALHWRLDANGEPGVEVDAARCRECGRCVAVCPSVTGFKGHCSSAAYACSLLDQTAVRHCSSGGAALALGQAVLERGGVVFGCAFQSGKCRHVRVDTLDGLEALSGSKYVWSDVEEIFVGVRDCLLASSANPVLFIGTPCQVAGLRRFLGELSSSERLYAVDLICHGTPSPKILEEFFRETEGAVPESLTCRDRQGVGMHGRLADGREFHYTGGFASHDYLLAYIHGLTYRECCYSCPYAQASRVGDLTLGDYWGIDRRHLPADAPELLNILLVNTSQGERLLEQARSKLACVPVPVSAELAGKTNLQHPQPRPPERERYLRNVTAVGVANALRGALRHARWRVWRSGLLHRVKEWFMGGKERKSRLQEKDTLSGQPAKSQGPRRILLGGVPLGCDNVGDEAIVTCVVKLLKSLFPNCELTVCTREPTKTAELLGVRTVPLYGFEPEPDLAGFAEEVRRHDVFIWFGATGLSDYPETALKLLKIARRNGVERLVWGVGMNSELNPAFYRAAGKRRWVLRLLSRLSMGIVDCVAGYERWLAERTRRHIAQELDQCRMVVLRDADSVAEVRRCGFDGALEGADTAILLESAPKLPLKPLPSQVVRIGFCISAQRAIQSKDGIVELWNNLLDNNNLDIVLIPMNPKTDRPLMLELAARTKCPGRIECLEEDAPSVVQACVSQCCAVVSSRLHLLILAANVGVPFIGIERGSKISTWLRQFGRVPAGSVENCDFAEILRQLEDILAESPEAARKRILRVTASMHQRLYDCAAELRRMLI